MASETLPAWDEELDMRLTGVAPYKRWWEFMRKEVADREQLRPLKVATACSGLESPIIAARADVVCAYVRPPKCPEVMSRCFGEKHHSQLHAIGLTRDSWTRDEC